MIDPSLKTPGVIVAEVLMSIAAGKQTHILVEGPSDSQFWRGYCVADNEIVICGGKRNVEVSMQKLDAGGIARLAAIVDDDMNSLLGLVPPSGRVFFTDDHDLESMLMSSDALRVTLLELVDPSSVAAFEKTEAKCLHEALVERAMWFGRLRFVSLANAHHVNFSCLSARKYLDEKTWTLDTAALLNDYSVAAGITLQETEKLLDRVPAIEDWRLIHGKDAFDLMIVALDGLFDHRTSERVLFTNLRIAYRTRGCLFGTRLWSELKMLESVDGATIFC